MKQVFSTLVVALLFQFAANAQTIYARTNGDWHVGTTWSTTGPSGVSCSCTPSTSDSVVIDGRDVVLLRPANSVKSVTVTTSTAKRNASLTIEAGETLTVDNNVYLIADKDAYHVTLQVDDDSSTLDINGNLYANIQNGENININMNNQTYIDIEADFISNMTGSTGGSLNINLDCDDGSNNFLVGEDFIINKTSALNVFVDLTNKADLVVTDSLIIDCSSSTGSSIEFQLADSANLDVNGSMIVDIDNSADAIDFIVDLDDASSVEVGVNNGSLSESTVIDVLNGDDIFFQIDGDSWFNNYGDFTLVQQSSGNLSMKLNAAINGSVLDAQFNVHGDFEIDGINIGRIQMWLYQDADLWIGGQAHISSQEMKSGFDANIVVRNTAKFDIDKSLFIDLSDGSQTAVDFELDLDDDGQFIVGTNNSDSCTIKLTNMHTFNIDLEDDASFSTSGKASFYNINATTGGISQILLGHDAQMSVNSTLYFYDDTPTDFSLKLNELTDGSGADAKLTVGDDLYIEKSRGENFTVSLDRDAAISVTNDFTLELANAVTSLVWMNLTADGGSTDGQLIVGGDFQFLNTASNASQFSFNQSSDLDVGGDMIMNSVGSLQFEHNGNGTIDVDGNFVQKSEAASSSPLYLSFKLEDVTFTVGSTNSDTFLLLLKNGEDLDFFLKQNSSFTSSGNVRIRKEIGGTGDLNLELDGDAQMTVNGLLDVYSKSADLHFEINEHANGSANDVLLTVNGDVHLEVDAGNSFELDVQRDGVMDVNGDLNIASSANSNTTIWTNYNYPGSGTFALLDVQGDLNISKTNGDNFEMRARNGSKMKINGDVNLSVSNLDGSYDDTWFIVHETSIIDIDGSLTSTVDRSSVISNIDLGIDLEDSGQLLIGSTTNDSASFINNAGGSVILNMDHDAQFVVAGNLRMENNGRDDNSILLNAVAAGTSTDAELNVGGDFVLLGASTTDFTTITLEYDASISVTGDFIVEHGGAEAFYMDLNDVYNGGDSDAQIITGGDFSLTKANGSFFDLNMEYESEIVVGGNFSFQDNYHTSSSQNSSIQLDDSAKILAAGSVELLLNSQGSSSNDLSVILEDNSSIEVGELNGVLPSNLNLTASRGDDVFFDIENNSHVSVYGDFNVIKSGADDINIRMYHSSNLYISGDFDLDNTENSDVLQFFQYNSSVSDIDGNIDLLDAQAAGRVKLDLNSTSHLKLAGNFLRSPAPNNYGLVDTETNSTITYDGTDNTQWFAASAGAGSDGIEYNKVVINNTFSVVPQLTMEGDAIIYEHIEFTDGIVKSASDSIIIVVNNATSSEGNSESFVNGPFRKIGDDAFVFPIGNTYWARLAMNAPTGTSSSYDAQYLRVNPGLAGYNTESRVAGVNNVSTLEYWFMTQQVASSTNLLLTLYWEVADSSKITDLTDLRVVRYNESSSWSDLSQSGTTGSANPSANGTITAGVSVDKFGAFTFGSGSLLNNPLPVELLSFNAEPIDRQVQLSWATSSEINSDRFEVERSFNGLDFHSVGSVEAAGNSNDQNNYAWLDEVPEGQFFLYYRLVQYDRDNSSKNSHVESVSISRYDSKSKVLVYPNPVNTNNWVDIQGLAASSEQEEINITVYNATGAVVFEKHANSINGSLRFKSPDKPGFYFLKVRNGNTVDSFNILVE